METLNNKKSKKGMISRIIFGLIIISSWAVLGVALAISSAKLNVGGGITFTATNVYADVDGVLNGTANDKSLSTISFNADTTAPFTTPSDWTNIDFSFGDGNYEISITITITNRSAERAVYLAFEDNIEAENLTITRKHKKKNDADYTTVDSFSNMTIEKNTENNPQMLQILMKVTDPNLSVKNGTFSLNINLSSEEIKDTSEYQTLSFSQNDDGTMSVAKNTSNLPTGDLIIPAQVKYNGKICDVTMVADNGFENCEITSVYFPSTITKIGASAFAGSGLTTLTIPDTVKIMGNYAFLNCASLETLNLDASSTSYAYGVFRSCTALKAVDIGSGCNGFKEGWFSNCTALEEIVIPSHIKTLNYCLFQNCYALKSVTIQEGVTTLEQGAFVSCTSLASITIPSSVTTIRIDAFSECTKLGSVTFENPDGWTANGESLDLSDPAQNATFLTTTYKDYVWTRT